MSIVQSTISSTAPAYVRVASQLRQRILSGALKPGERLSTEQQLCRKWNISRITARQALRLLEDEQLILRRQGSGTYVALRAQRKIPLIQSGYSRSVSMHAPELLRRVLRWDWLQADKRMTNRLPVTQGDELCEILRLDEIRGEAVAVDRIWIREPFARNLSKKDLERLDFLERWQVTQDIDHFDLEQRIEAVRSNALSAKYIGVARSSPILKEKCDIYPEPDLFAMRVVTYYRSEVFQLGGHVHFHRNGKGALKRDRK